MPAQPIDHEITFADPDDAALVWRFDVDFLTSNWTCIWGRGCVGILDEPDADAGHGCCSLGAEILDEEEAMNLSALTATLPANGFERFAEAWDGGIFADRHDGSGWHTRVVSGACIFFNRPSFAGGGGCALHVAALAHDEPVMDWKPSVCWQLPVKLDHDHSRTGETVVHVRRWQRDDFGPGGRDMAWLCTEDTDDTGLPSAHVGEGPVVETLGDELSALLGPHVFDELRARLGR